MFMEKASQAKAMLSKAMAERRRHKRVIVMKRALLFPIEQQIAFPVNNISHRGVAGVTSVPLTLRQCVHLGFNDERYLQASVRWIEGTDVGLELNDPLMFMPGSEPMSPGATPDQLPRATRVPVNMQASLIISAPYWSAIVRDVSAGGMRIQTPQSLPEGEPLLVQLSGRPAYLGRVQWSRQGCIGVQFGQQIDLGALVSNMTGTN